VTSDQFVDLVVKKAKVLKPYLDFLNAAFFDKEPFLKVEFLYAIFPFT